MPLLLPEGDGMNAILRLVLDITEVLVIYVFYTHHHLNVFGLLLWIYL